MHLANEDPSRVVTRAEGQNVTFKCRADARPPVTSYSWFKNVSTKSSLTNYVDLKEYTMVALEMNENI